MGLLPYDSTDVYDTWAWTYDGIKTRTRTDIGMNFQDVYRRQPLVEQVPAWPREPSAPSWL